MKPQTSNTNKKRVVIVGGGFAGINLAKKISGKNFEIVLIDKNNYHQFQPLLYQVATGGLEPSSISFPLRKIFKQYKDISLRMAEVTAININPSTVTTNVGEIEYNYLVLAQGATTNFFNNKSVQENAYTMKSISEALLLRNTLLENYEKAITATEQEREALLNVVIVGGGPTGVELAGTIAEMKNKILPKDYPELNFNQMSVYLVEASSQLLTAMSNQSSSKVITYLEDMGVEVIIGNAVKNYQNNTVTLNDGKILKTNCVIWAAGVKGQAIPGLPSDSIANNDRILVDEFNKVHNTANVYAIGDIALMITDNSPKGHPQVAPVAIQQALTLAKNLIAKGNNQPLKKFVYNNQGAMATVGKNKAVVELASIKMQGYFAWAIWMFIHLMSIIGIKNRIFILLNWMWHYFTYDPSLRLIIKQKIINLYPQKLKEEATLH
ncbi:MAG: NAD(P)/FAD-dependent oxidoreductase [Bacteroidia bacterium]|nr:NAD(P)/FAD-dependent oxidoreductase [Bacteroidia bacterium]